MADDYNKAEQERQRRSAIDHGMNPSDANDPNKLASFQFTGKTGNESKNAGGNQNTGCLVAFVAIPLLSLLTYLSGSLI